MLVPTLETVPSGDLFLKEFENLLSAYTQNFIHDYRNVTSYVQESIPDQGFGIEEFEDKIERGEEHPRQRLRRQLVSPDLSNLQSGYSKFFGMKKPNRRNFHKKRGKDEKKESSDNDMPIVLVPQEDETECVASNQLSSFGFMGFILNVVNAVINVANNINNNDNSNNDNNNNNNNNDLNTNQAAITQTVTNTNMAMAMAGRRLEQLRMMREELRGNLNALKKYRSKRSPWGHESSKDSDISSSDYSCLGDDIVEEALLVAVALIDMWKDLLFEDDPSCMALELCETSLKLSRVSRLATMMVDVAGVAAANMLKNFQGVNPEYLTYAAEKGFQGANCRDLYPECRYNVER